MPSSNPAAPPDVASRIVRDPANLTAGLDVRAGVYGTSVATQYGLARAGKIPGAFRVGRQWRFPLEPLRRDLGIELAESA